jgi:tripartite-type tricarboxylate transporter receptor subunit TctC
MKPFSRWAVILLAACCSGVQAQPYPSQPIKVVVPYPAGGYYDFIARVVGHEMSEHFGQPVIVDNRSGANAIIGTEFTAKSPADGYTIMVGGIGPHAINASLYSKLPYDPVRDFAPIILVATQPLILVAHPSVPANSVRELIAAARARPGALTYASAGSGSSPHLAGVMLSSAAEVELNHIPFKGMGPAITAILGGQTDLLFSTLTEALAHVRAGKLRSLAVTSGERIEALPDVPTMIEAGVPDFDAPAWYAYFAPAATPRAIIDKLNAEIQGILKIPQVRERLSAKGTTQIVGGTAERLRSFQKSEIARWAKVIAKSGAKAD